MKRTLLFLATLTIALSLSAAESKAPKPAEPPSRGDRMLAEYFRSETASLAGRCLADIQSLEDWKAKREEYRRQLQEMLGLWPMPARTDLKPVITGRLEHDEFFVEKLHFQASPHLYVTANLWLPKNVTKPAPAILYVCGHGRVFTNGVSCGNKTSYQHHGAWFARNGYVCLTIDTVQLGEIEGLHHGTYREGMWWWNSRGYTPAGVEAWFGIRALDYLCSRPEVDATRIGMTGRSGGGSYSWTVAALDDRVKVVAPIAGITDLQNQVVDCCVEGHCDCMFFVNTYRRDFPLVAALIAPRPLLLGNSDKDTIFPLDGVERLHDKVRRIYRLHGETNKLGLLITEGPHKDTQDLQVPVFRWFNRWLKGEEPVIEMAAKKFFPPMHLRVFDQLPADEINTKIHESFGPEKFLSLGLEATVSPTGGERRDDDSPSHSRVEPLNPVGTRSTASPSSPTGVWDAGGTRPYPLLAALRAKVFAGWPAESLSLDVRRVFSVKRDGLRFSAWDFTSQPGVTLRLYVAENSRKRARGIELEVLDSGAWAKWLATAKTGFAAELSDELAGAGKVWEADTAGFVEWKRRLKASDAALAWFAPRGVGLSAWSGDAKKQAQIRRRFMLLGQTLDGMRVWDIRCAAQAVQSLPEFKKARLCVQARGDMGVNALYAGLFESGIARLDLANLPPSHREGPDYLNVLKVLDIPQTLELAGKRVTARQAETIQSKPRMNADGHR